MAPEGAEGEFRVTDRRRRSEGDEPPPATPVSRPTPPPAPPGRPPEPSPGDESERSLVGLFMMLGSSALMALGEVADPMSGQAQPDLPGAADVIDVLVLLREKTEGHRTAEETQTLDELVYDLQLRYVNARERFG
jgi:Domain of unknown function (DUF1844)